MTAEPVAPAAETVGTWDEYRALREEMAGKSLAHLCETCGRCEPAGGFCSWDRTAEYVVVAHVHEMNTSGCVAAGTGPGRIFGRYRHPTRSAQMALRAEKRAKASR